MTLVDTNVWIEHFMRPVRELSDLLEADEVLVHPFVLGELALGRLARREEIFERLNELEPVPKAEDKEVLFMIKHFQLAGKGLGWVDCHLMASARLAGARFLSHDMAIKQAWVKIQR
jgi:predicted nucleic acid-binding protein